MTTWRRHTSNRPPKDYVEAQWLTLQQDEPGDYVIATGQQNSVREFIELSAKELDISIEWEGQGVEEVGRVAKSAGDGGPRPGDVIVKVDPRYFRPTEVEALLGDPAKAKRQLGWQPRISLQEMIKEMITQDLQLAQRDTLVAQEGFRVFDHHE